MTERLRHARVCVYRIARRALRRARALIHELGFETDLFVLPLRRLDRARAGIAEEFALAVGDGFDGDGAETRVNLQSSVRVALGAGGVLLRRRAVLVRDRRRVDARGRCVARRLGARQRFASRDAGRSREEVFVGRARIVAHRAQIRVGGLLPRTRVPIEG